MERKKRSKSSGWECCYANNIFGTFGVEMRACGQKFVNFFRARAHTHTHTHTHAAKLVVAITLSESTHFPETCYAVAKQMDCDTLKNILIHLFVLDSSPQWTIQCMCAIQDGCSGQTYGTIFTQNFGLQCY